MGGRDLSSSSVSMLNRFMEDSGMTDLGFSGSKYTQYKELNGRVVMKETLDRAICNIEWKMLFNEASIQNLPIVCSDHGPILVKLVARYKIRKKAFRFEKMWVTDDDFLEVVSRNWSNSINTSLHGNLE
ncbi:hypothetical protein Ancab_040413 [Ancistrocladus abbreviatus]